MSQTARGLLAEASGPLPDPGRLDQGCPSPVPSEGSGDRAARRWRIRGPGWLRAIRAARRRVRKVPFLWRGRARFCQGYDTATVGFLRSLRDLGVDVSFAPFRMEEGREISLLPKLGGWLPELDAGDAEMEGEVEVVFGTAEGFQFARGGIRIGFTMMETSRFRPEWVERASRMDEVWVPTEFNRQGFQASGLRVPCEVVPLGVDPEIFRPDGPAFRLPDRFVFLSVFAWSDRHAPASLFKAFQAAFSREDPVLLLCKVNTADALRDAAGEIRRMGLSSKRGSILLVWNRNLSSQEMAALYRSADAMVTSTRGEGWGLPLLEAMACGIPVIAPAWGGHTAFLSEANSFPAKIRGLVPATEKTLGLDPHYQGLFWADPDGDDLSARMRELFENREAARAKGLAASGEARARWTWESAARKIRARLKQLGHDF